MFRLSVKRSSLKDKISISQNEAKAEAILRQHPELAFLIKVMQLSLVSNCICLYKRVSYAVSCLLLTICTLAQPVYESYKPGLTSKWTPLLQFHSHSEWQSNNEHLRMTLKETASFVWVTKLTVSHGTSREVFCYNLPNLKRQINNYWLRLSQILSYMTWSWAGLEFPRDMIVGFCSPCFDAWHVIRSLPVEKSAWVWRYDNLSRCPQTMQVYCLNQSYNWLLFFQYSYDLNHLNLIFTSGNKRK